MLKGKVALITGASRGIGRAIARRFAMEDAFVGINYYKSEDKARSILKEIKIAGGNGILLKGDVSSLSDSYKIVNELIKNGRKIDIVILNAGIYNRSSFIDLTEEQWKKTIDVNLTGAYNICKSSLPHINDNGSIIFISSQLALKGSFHGADYAASKAGILGLMKSLALELAPRRIRVNAIAPGTIDTDLLSSYTEEMKKGRISQIPLRRLGTAEDIANVTLFLASNLSSYITGETINVNGGLYIH